MLARARYALVTVSDWWYSGLRGVVFGDGPGGMVSLETCLWPLCASSRMVGGVQPLADAGGPSCVVFPSLGVSCSLGRRRGCWRCKTFNAVSMSLGPGISRPAFHL